MRTKFSISFSACVILALMLFILPLQWVFAALAAACIHEAFHIAAIRLCGGKVTSIRIGGNEASIDLLQMSPAKEMICALAGPLGGLLLILFARWIPRIAVCAAFQSIYNLLPLYPLDGGRALRCAIILMKPESADEICAAIQRFLLILLLIFAVYACFGLKLGIMPLLFAAALCYKTKNTPCKPPLLKVQ